MSKDSSRALLLGRCCWCFWRRRFLSLPVGVFKPSFLPPFYPLGLLLQRACATSVLLLPLTVLPVVLLVGVFPTTLAPSCGAGPPAAGCHLPALVRGIWGDGWSRSWLLGARSTQLRPPNLATGRLGRSSPDPRPRIASFRAGPSPGRPAARCLVASSSAGPVRWFPTKSETANGLDSSLLLRPTCGTF